MASDRHLRPGQLGAVRVAARRPARHAPAATPPTYSRARRPGVIAAAMFGAVAAVCAAVLVVAVGELSYTVTNGQQPDATTTTATAASDTTADPTAGTPGLLAAIEAGDDPCITDVSGDAGGVASYQSCWEALFAEAVDTVGSAAAVAAAHAAGETFPLLLNNCHEIMHQIGRSSYANARDPIDALAADDGSCQYGFRHGVLESFALGAAQSRDGTAIEAVMRDLCTGKLAAARTARADDAVAATIDAAECMHALGHAAAVFHGDDIGAAAGLCALADTANVEDQKNCAGGVLMEYGNSYLKSVLGDSAVLSNSAHGPGNAKMTSSQAAAVCDLIADEYGSECYRRASNFWGPEFGDDIAGLFAACVERAGEHQHACAQSVGEWVARVASNAEYGHLSAAERAQLIVVMCSAGTTDQMLGCIEHTAYQTRSNDLWARRTAAESMNLCAYVPDEAAETCAASSGHAEDAYTASPYNTTT